MPSQNEDQDEITISLRLHSQDGIKIYQNRTNSLIISNEIEEKCGIIKREHLEKNVSISSGTVTWQDGSTYIGCFKNSKRFGNGSMTWRDGSTYTGDWVNDDMNGVGKFEKKNSFSCNGTWQEGLYTYFEIK